MDTSVSDVSISDFTESRRVVRKRKRKIAPLDFVEDPLDATFYSPDRPRAANNPLGTRAVHVTEMNSWISVDEFGRKNQRNMHQTPSRNNLDSSEMVTCSRRDCVNRRHQHAALLEFSDNDSDLLLSVNDSENEQKPEPASQKTDKLQQTLARNCSYVTPDSSHVSRFLQCSAGDATGFKAVGYSQCKSVMKRPLVKTKRTSSPQQEVRRLYDKENCKKRVVFDSPALGTSEHSIKASVVTAGPVVTAGTATPNTAEKSVVGRHLSTPDSGTQVVYVEDTPEHLLGLRMVTRRLRKVLGTPVLDSLQF